MGEGADCGNAPETGAICADGDEFLRGGDSVAIQATRVSGCPML